MMKHQEAANWIFDLRDGKLPAELQAPVSHHVESCETCRRALSVFDTLGRASRLEAEIESDHADADELVRSVVEPTTLDESRRRALAAHVSGCVTCAAELEAVREAEREIQAARRPERAANVSPFPIRDPVVRWRRLSLAASGIAALLFVSFGYVALWRLPEIERRFERSSAGSRSAAAGAGAAVSLPLFSGALRDEGQTPELRVAAGATMLPVAVASGLPRGTPDTKSFRFVIADTTGRTIFSLDLSAARIRRLSGESGVVALLVPLTPDVAGPHVLTLADIEHGAVLIEQPFTLVREVDEASAPRAPHP